MTTPSPWPTLEERELLDCRVFTVASSRARSPRTGEEHEFFRIDCADWVNVVPLTDDDRVVLVRQYRHGSRDVTLEIPGGMVDPGEDPLTSARRELREETGFDADDWQRLGGVNPNPALFGNTCHTFLARGARRVGEIRNEGAEETAVVTVARDELPGLVRGGAITHALVIAALHWWSLDEGC